LAYLLFRYELKYFINKTDNAFLSETLSSFLPKDEHGINGNYNVRSLYFDDFEKSAIFQKKSGIFDRTKFRIRHYNNSRKLFKLECKSRIRDMVEKKSTIFTIEDLQFFQSGAIQTKFFKSDDNLYNFFCSKVHTQSLIPAFIVEYQRSAWRSKYSDFSVTIDKNITSHLDQTDLLQTDSVGVPVIDNGLDVLELKFMNDYPCFINSILASCSLQRYALSKYVAATKFTKLNKWEDQ